MANYTELINAINTNIVDNDNHLISGSTLNEILLSIVNAHKDSLDEVNTVINTLSEPVNINISGSVSDIASLPTDSSAGDLYFVNSDEYVYNGSEWILVGPSVNLNNHINVVIPENIYNGISVPLPGYTFFNITERDINNLINGIAGSVNITDNRLKIDGEPTYATGTISYNRNGSLGYGNLTVSYIYNGTMIIYDIEVHYTYAKVYVTEK